MITFAENTRIMIREAILKAMETRKVSQTELAEHLGMSRSSMNNYLAGRRKMSIENIEKALSFLGLKIVLKNK